MKTNFLVILCIFSTISIAWAKPPNNQQQGHSPPPEAISACDSKNDGDVCSFTTPGGNSISGKCVKKDKQSFCVPQGHFGKSEKDSSAQGEPPKAPPKEGMQGDNQQRHPPPPEAISACESKNNGDTCSFTTPHGDTISGKCVKNDKQSFCVPQGHSGKSPKGLSAHKKPPEGSQKETEQED